MNSERIERSKARERVMSVLRDTVDDMREKGISEEAVGVINRTIIDIAIRLPGKSSK